MAGGAHKHRQNVLSGLIKAGVPVRASSRDPKMGDFPEGIEVVSAEPANTELFAQLFEGELLLYCNAEAPEDSAALRPRPV